jgi:hypothetical protein
LERPVIYSEDGVLGLVWLETGRCTVFVTEHVGSASGHR